MKYLLVLIAQYLMIGCKAWQQLNVVHSNYYSVPVAGFFLAAGEVIVYGSVAIVAVTGGVIDAMLMILALWVGGFLGTWTGMYLHKRYLR